MGAKEHWEKVYRDKSPTEVSWYQPDPRLSFQLITQAAPERSSRIIDVGGGASELVDRLAAAGYSSLTVLDLSEAALAAARRRMGTRAPSVRWIEGDVLDFEPDAPYDVWHDRAVFHFLTDPADRARYVRSVSSALRPGGTLLVATFADDGPTRCSGLDAMRYGEADLHGEFWATFDLVESRREVHVTPSGAEQRFVYCLCRHIDPARPGRGRLA